MSNIGAIENNEEVLVLRIDHKNTILQILYYTQTFRRLSETIIHKNFQDIGLTKAIYKECEVHLKQVFVTLKKETFRLHIGKRYYHIFYLPECKGNGQVENVLTIVRDVTKEQNTKKKWMMNQFQFQMSEQISRVGYFDHDIPHGNSYWSEQQYKNFGYIPNNVTPTRELFLSHIHPDDWDRMQTVLVESSGKSYAELTFRLIKADGTVGWLYSRINSITNEQGCCIRRFGITQDITEQKQAEERIQRVGMELAFASQLYNRSTHLNKLLFNENSVEQITRVLNEVGIDTQAAHCCVVIKLTESLAYKTELIDDTIDPMIERKQSVIIWLEKRERGLVWRCRDDIVILVPLSDYIATNKQSQIQFANDMTVEIEKEFPYFIINVGITGMSSIAANFRDSYEKSYRAAVIAETMASSTAIHYDDIGLYEVAFPLLQDKNTWEMVENTIGRLAGHDEARGSNLLITLEYILEQASLKTVAQQLFIHHNTVIWRKRKIEMFLGMSLDKMEMKMLLLLYIKIWNLKKCSSVKTLLN